MSAFLTFLRERHEKGGFTTEDALASVLPLFRQAAGAHEAGFVAPLRGVERLTVEGIVVRFDDPSPTRPCTHNLIIESMNRPSTNAFEVMSMCTRSYDVDSSTGRMTSQDIASPDEPLTEPSYIPGYLSWEHLFDHHDPLADQMVLGLILASVACGFDFTRRPDLEEFVRHRRNLFAVSPHLNPVLAQVIVRMTELDRHRRARDLGEIVRLLETYRDQPVDFDIDVNRVDAQRKTEGPQRRTLLLERLQERLFEISRRNRLLYFKPSQKYLNLTVASVPALFDVRGIRPEQLMTWNAPVEEAFSSGKPIALGHYLRFEDAPYLPGALDSIISEVRRDEAELGFSQLRVVLCFLRWHNLKEAPQERIDSPLLLLKVKLTKKKGVRDSYTLQPAGHEAEVNPVLRYHLRTIYGIHLPESIELTPGALDRFHEELTAEVRRSEPGVTIEKIARPHVEIIHDRARRRLDQYKRRLRPERLRATQTLHDLSYSYRGHIDPLGLKLFQTFVFPAPAPMREIVDANPVLRNFMVAPFEEGGLDRERTMVAFHESTSDNPYAWDYDLCNLTLGNFKYRKMSLVRDYETLLSDTRSSRPFDAIFSLAPKPEMAAANHVPMEEQHTIVECDPTQASAIAHARRGESYIIQGPPGTGKSQTITNLIAEYLARGKRVLFVCEKRAALDVVYHRLRQKKLESLCCLIHDSQDDKKEFIADLRTTYEGLLQETGIDVAQAERRRRNLIDAMRIDLGALSAFDQRMRDDQPAGMPLRSLLARGIELHRFTPSLTPLEMERVPEYRAWIDHERSLKRVGALLQNASTGPVFGTHPLRRLNPSIASQARPHEVVTSTVERIGRVLDDLMAVLSPVALGTGWDTLANVLAVARHAQRIEPLLERQTYGVLDPRHSLAHALDAVRLEQQDLEERLEAATHANRNWRDKLTPDDTAIALDLARALEGNLLRFLKGEFWQLRKTLNERYAFSAHPVKPRWTQVLQRLSEEHELRASLARIDRKAAAQFHFDGSLKGFLEEVADLRRVVAEGSSVVTALHAHCLENVAARTTAGRLVGALRQLESVEEELGEFLAGEDERTLSDLALELREIASSMNLLNEALPIFGELSQLPEDVVAAIRRFPISLTELEAASAQRTIQRAFAHDAAVAKVSLPVRERHIERLARSYRELQRENVHTIVGSLTGHFRAHVATSSRPSAQLSRTDLAFKKRYSSGRRELEHEFGKSMRYRSIRDLFSGPAGDVMLDLKPVWLMSPLSVSDTLPLDTSHFDVVIFDEASQIPLEEAIPSLFRADQIIVVGDQMQLPPTSFFSSKQEQDEDIVVDDDGDLVALNLDSDSFLNHAARNLHSTMLGWHYRSRSESLISYSNAAFYQGRLLTVPDPAGRNPQRAIEAQRAETGFENASHVLDRSLSFHAIPSAVYEERRNTSEAFYIAHLVRGLLMRETGQSIGIIAFSEAQQGEIERALGILAADDPEFAARLEAEYAREENDQFIGLLVKNLENIQGDERDIVILSVCYGRNRDGRILMNFGPINQSGGEKRLNVAFSRAKKHMALVSSIRHADVTNTYNDGANSLRRYLKYAEAMSIGDDVTARSVLRESGLPEPLAAAEIDRDAVVRDVAESLRAEGYEIGLGIGQSHFRCDVAVKKPGDLSYRAAILVDTDAYYRQADLLERDLLRPTILANFGWRVLRVLSKDWWEKREVTLDQLMHDIERDDEVEVAPEAESEPEPIAELFPIEIAEPLLQIAASPRGATFARRFELVDGGSYKFWEIRIEGAEQAVHFGRIGTSGQIRTKTFADETTAQMETEKLIREKVRKGYREMGEEKSAADSLRKGTDS